MGPAQNRKNESILFIKIEYIRNMLCYQFRYYFCRFYCIKNEILGHEESLFKTNTNNKGYWYAMCLNKNVSKSNINIHVMG